jgi:hypothetical protein
MESFFFTQCAAVLFDRAPPLEDVERALEPWGVSARSKQGLGEAGWAVCGPGFVVELRSGVPAIVDVVDRAWPDDAAAAEAVPALGAAFRAGVFGPGSTPGALARAMDQPWLWSEGAAVARRHGGFVRLRTGHAMEAREARTLAAGHDPVYELTSLTQVAQAVLRLPGALALFVPAGEALRSPDHVDAALARKVGVGPPAFDLWSNVRAVALLREGDVQWLLLDVVGMGQLRLPDQEAIFAEGREEPAAVEALLRNACMHLLLGHPIAPGSTSDDARGRRWRASAARGIVAPPRPVVRWSPEESPVPSEATIAKLSSAAGAG